jgi:hypothetical protein
MNYLQLTVWMVLSVPLIENFMLTEHATIYSYDRLKWLLPLTFGVALLATYLIGRRHKWLYLFIAAMAISGAISGAQYRSTFSLETNLVGDIPLGEAACQNGGRRISEYVTANSTPDDAIFINSNLFPILLFPYSGDRPIAVTDISGAHQWLRDYDWRQGKIFIVGGSDFDRPGDSLPLGGVTAVISTSEPDGTISVRLRRADLPQGMTVAGNEFPVHNPVISELIGSGAVAQVPGRADISVLAWNGNRLILGDDATEITELIFVLDMTPEIGSVKLDSAYHEDLLRCVAP